MKRIHLFHQVMETSLHDKKPFNTRNHTNSTALPIRKPDKHARYQQTKKGIQRNGIHE